MPRARPTETVNQAIRGEFSLQRYSAGDMLQFIVANGAVHHDSPDSDTERLPGLSKVAKLQERNCDTNGNQRHYGADDPLVVLRYAQSGSHERWVAHSQAACSLTKNAMRSSLIKRSTQRVRRYGEALMKLVEMAESAAGEETTSIAIASDSAAPVADTADHATMQAAYFETERSGSSADRDEMNAEEEEDEGIEGYALRHRDEGIRVAAAWLHRRYLHCCDRLDVLSTAEVTLQLSRAVQKCEHRALGAFFEAQNAASPLYPKAARYTLPTTAALAAPVRSWMSFPESLEVLREWNAVPFEVNPDFHDCGTVGKNATHFVAIIGALEGCRNTVVSLNLSNTNLSDSKVQVLCLLCHAYLRRLRSLDLSNNPAVSERVAPRLKKLAASLPLLSTMCVTGTGLTSASTRTIDRLLSRKVQ